MNWLNYLAEHLGNENEVRVYTMYAEQEIDQYESPIPFIQIIRYRNSGNANSLRRLWNYLGFYSFVTRKFGIWKPDRVMYYETVSALPAILYKRIFNRNSYLIIHYHEYTSIKEYQRGMMINRWGHLLEKKVYPFCHWISHTNEDRMQLFISDHQGVKISNKNILPNYPPKSWTSENRKDQHRPPVKFVYVGALSLDTMYIREFSEWVIKQNGQASLTIYSGNITADTKAYIQSLNTERIRFQGEVNYFTLPDILKQYDAGVILYKGHIPNYIYNAPNKLFEYWACGLDVWFPKNMLSILRYVSVGSYPKIVPVDFEYPDSYHLTDMTDRAGLVYKPSIYFCEEDFGKLLMQTMGSQRSDSGVSQ